ncbi:MAG: winged helix-turn-helix transcriptional regulator [Acidimicrobiia bacterium]|nr:winged helix-turn-helix transcriptional regulator [Acidimicrobiia bacterium]
MPTGIDVGAGIVTRADGLRHLSREWAAAFLGLVRAGEVLERQLNAELEAAHGIGLRGFEVLLFLAVFAPDGRLRMTELTEQAPLSQSRVSRLVAQLETVGLVARSAAEADGRGVEVSITAKGLATFKSAQDSHLAGLTGGSSPGSLRRRSVSWGP